MPSEGRLRVVSLVTENTTLTTVLFARIIAIVKRVGTTLSHNCQKKKSVKREFLSLRIVTRKMNDTIMMYKNLAIDCMYF